MAGITKFTSILLLGLVVLGGTIAGAYAQQLALQKSTKVIKDVETGQNTIDPQVLKTHQQALQQEIEFLEKIPPIPLVIKRDFPIHLQKIRSLLPQVTTNIKNSEALQTAEKKAMEAAVLVQNAPHPLTIWQQAEVKWYEVVTILQGIDPNTIAGKVAQEKLVTYINNYQSIGQRVIIAEQAVNLNNQGVSAVSSGNFPQAIIYFTKAIETNPALAEAHMGRGITYTQLEKYQQALPDFDQAIKFNSQLTDAYFKRGLVYYKLGKLEQAIADHTKAIQLDANYGVAYLEKGAIQYQLGNPQLAIADLQKALQIFLNNGDNNNLKLTQAVLAKMPAISTDNELTNVKQDLDSCEGSWQEISSTEPCYWREDPNLEADFDRRPDYYRTRYPDYYRVRRRIRNLVPNNNSTNQTNSSPKKTQTDNSQTNRTRSTNSHNSGSTRTRTSRSSKRRK